jgi:hypothetical protein
MFKTLRLFMVCTLFGLAALPATATAQDINVGQIGNSGQQEPVINQYDKKYKAKNRQYRVQRSLLPESRFWLYFVNEPGTAPGHAVLRIAQPLSISGCMMIDMPDPEITINGADMWVTLQKPHVRAGTRLPDGQSCKDTKQGNATTSISLDTGAGIRSIAFRTTTGMDYYDVEADDTHIALVPRSMNYFKPYNQPGRKDVLRQWLYPDDTIILSVPRAAKEKNLSAEITALARQHGLTPMAETIRNFESPLSDTNTLYFVDGDGKTAQQVDRKPSFVLGTVTEAETFYAPGRQYQKPRNLDVLARRPGPLD